MTKPGPQRSKSAFTDMLADRGKVYTKCVFYCSMSLKQGLILTETDTSVWTNASGGSGASCRMRGRPLIASVGGAEYTGDRVVEDDGS